jgi:hypothetical protein
MLFLCLSDKIVPEKVKEKAVFKAKIWLRYGPKNICFIILILMGSISQNVLIFLPNMTFSEKKKFPSQKSHFENFETQKPVHNKMPFLR